MAEDTAVRSRSSLTDYGAGEANLTTVEDRRASESGCVHLDYFGSSHIDDEPSRPERRKRTSR